MKYYNDLLAHPRVFKDLGIPANEWPAEPYACDQCGAVKDDGVVDIHCVFEQETEDGHLWYQGLACCHCAGHLKTHVEPALNRAERRRRTRHQREA